MDYSELGTPPLYAVQEFVAALAAATDGVSVQSNLTAYESPKPLIDGRIIFTPKPPSHNQGTPEIQIKYQSLNPAPQFRAVVDAARSVILAGGTMSPVRGFNAALSRKGRI
jgi:chromosome transmission fidelity protein 1